MKILVTGASGFLGKYILEQAKIQNDTVITLGRDESNIVKCDLSVSIPELVINDISVVIHSAGKAHMTPKTVAEKQAFFDINLQGTKNLIAAIDQSGIQLKQFIFISTVAVYGKEYGENITEDHALDGKSPYAKSKIEAEQFLQEWSARTGTPVLILRLPLVIGLESKGNLAKMINGIKSGKYVSIGAGTAQKSMVMAEDVTAMIWQNVGKSGVYNLTDGYHPSFGELEQMIARQLGTKIRFKLPISLAKLLGNIGNLIPKSPVNSELIKKMSLPLVFNDDLARKNLNWHPKKVLDSFRLM